MQKEDAKRKVSREEIFSSAQHNAKDVHTHGQLFPHFSCARMKKKKITQKKKKKINRYQTFRLFSIPSLANNRLTLPSAQSLPSQFAFTESKLLCK